MVAISLNEVDTLISYQEMKISFYSSWLGFIEIHVISPKYRYVDAIPNIRSIQNFHISCHCVKM